MNKTEQMIMSIVELVMLKGFYGAGGFQWKNVKDIVIDEITARENGSRVMRAAQLPQAPRTPPAFPQYIPRAGLLFGNES